MKRGELWWAQIDERRPVVLLSDGLLSDGAGTEFRAMQIVAPATPAEKRGFVVMSGEQASDPDERRRIVEAVGPDARAIGIEVFFGPQEGLTQDGVVRVALPKDGKIFCTWMLTIAEEHLIERIGVLSPAKLRELDGAMELSGAQ